MWTLDAVFAARTQDNDAVLNSYTIDGDTQQLNQNKYEV